jgi:hypothetical protein
VSGCGGDSEENGTAAKPRRQPVPKSLTSAESGAEDTVDFARQRNRDKVIQTARELRRTAEGPAGSALRSAGVPKDRIDYFLALTRLLDSLAPQSGFLRISLAANQVSGLMPDFYARFSDPVPPEVLRLDHLDREAQLRSLARDRGSVRRAVNELSSTWTELRRRVIDAGGRKTSAEFSRHVGAMRRLAGGSDQRKLQKEAVHGLALVDQLEQVFTK